MEAEVELSYLEERNEVVHAYSSHEKFKRIFNPELETNLENGLEKMAFWVKSKLKSPQLVKSSKMKGNGAQFPDIEIEKNLPNSWKNNR